MVRCQLSKKYGLNNSKKMKYYEAQQVLSNERVKIKSDIPILTELRLEHNKPDLMVHDLRSKQITLIEVGITNKHILANTETTKWRKYELLANDLKCMYQGHSVEIIPVVMTWNGWVTHLFKKYMKKLEVKNRLI